MQPFSCTFFQDVLAGHSLSMHSCSYGTTLNGDMRLLCHDAKKNNHRTPTARLPRAWRPADLVGDSHLLFRMASGPCAGGWCVIPGGFSWTNVRLARSTAAHGESEARLQIFRCLCQLWHFCAPIVCSPLAPAKADPAVKPALIPTALPASARSAWVSASSWFPPKWVPPIKKLFLLLEFFCNIRVNHTLHRCFWSWILTFLTG